MIPAIAVVSALAPIFALIVVGHLMVRRGFPGAAFWAPAERLTYFVLFPALLVSNLAVAPLDEVALGGLAAVLAGSVLIASLLMVAVRHHLGVDGPGFSSVFQGGIRFNTYVGLAAAAALFGTAGVTLAAVALAVLVPLVNVLCVTVLSRVASPPNASPWWLLRILARNPLILACLVGILLNVTGVGLPWGSGDTVGILARAALPLGLLAVGAGLNLGVLQDHPRATVATAVLKLLLLPLIAFTLARALGLPPTETGVAVIFTALPGAPSSYILARQMGGDAQLMAGLLTTQTLLGVLTLPLVLAMLL